MQKTLCLSVGLLLTACTSSMPADNEMAGKVNMTPPDFTVQAVAETPIVASTGDSADDPAIYVSAVGTGWIAGTDKQAGLYIYNLDGSQRDYFALGTLNNVDLREGWNGDDVVLVASNDEDRRIAVLSYDTSTDRFNSTLANIRVKEDPYGICLGKISGDFHVGVTTKAGIYYQYALSGDTAPSLALEREFSTNTKTEGCAFDDRTGQLYIAEEEGGLYRYASDPAAGDEVLQVLARPGDYGTTFDFEGVAVYTDGADAGHVVLSSQGNDSYALFSLPDHTFAGRFGVSDGAVDAVSHTDGLDVTSRPTAQFPRGFMVVQDNGNDGADVPDQERQNFKIIDWRDIEAGLNAK